MSEISSCAILKIALTGSKFADSVGWGKRGLSKPGQTAGISNL